MKKITIIEDNADNRLLVRVLLQNKYELTEFDNGFSALEVMQLDPPDLVLLDISLPEMDGVEILGKMRENVTLKHIPAIALTAHAMAGDREKYLSFGFNGYLTKPILDEQELISAIESLLT